MRLFGHVSKCLKGFFSEVILERSKAGNLFVLGLQQERERAGWRDLESSVGTSRDSGANYFSTTPRYDERGTCLILRGRAWNLGLLEGGSGWAVNLGNGEAETDGCWLRCSFPVLRAGIFAEREGPG